MAGAPQFFTLGSGPVPVLVITQLLASAPRSELFEPALRPLLDDFSFTFIDPLETAAALAAIVSGQWKRFLGFSLGGCLLQSRLTHPALSDAHVALVSSPVRMTAGLRERLAPVLEALDTGRVAEGLTLLDATVGVKGAHPEDLATAGERMRRGFAMLLRHDGEAAVRETSARLLQLVGGASRLVTRAEVEPFSSQPVIEIPDAGMRLVHERSQDVSERLARFWKGQ